MYMVLGNGRDGCICVRITLYIAHTLPINRSHHCKRVKTGDREQETTLNTDQQGWKDPRNFSV